MKWHHPGFTHSITRSQTLRSAHVYHLCHQLCDQPSLQQTLLWVTALQPWIQKHDVECSQAQSSLITGHHRLLCKLVSVGQKWASWARAIIFFPSSLQVTEHPPALTQLSGSSKTVLKWYSTTFSRALSFRPSLTVQSLLPKVLSGWILLECNSSLRTRPARNLFWGQCESWSGMLIESSLFIDIDYFFSKYFQYRHEDLQRSSYCITVCSIHKTFTRHFAEQ